MMILSVGKHLHQGSSCRTSEKDLSRAQQRIWMMPSVGTRRPGTCLDMDMPIILCAVSLVVESSDSSNRGLLLHVEHGEAVLAAIQCTAKNACGSPLS